MEDLILRLKLDGWGVIEDVIPEDEVDAVRERVAAVTEQHRNPNAPKNIGHLSGLINYDQSFAPYLADKRLLKLAKALLGPHVRISFTTATINEPGNARGGWHADWPFNQRNAGHLPAPYPDMVAHLTTLWMLSPFTTETGGTLLVSGSHRMANNPTGDNGVDPLKPYPTERQASGKAGSVLVMDSRLWHATAPNISDQPRVAIAIRFAPWWLDLKVFRPGSVERARLQQVTGKPESQIPLVPRQGL